MAPPRALHRVAVYGRHVCASKTTATPTGAQEEDVDLDSVAYGFMASQALFAALELTVFDKVAELDGASAEQLKEACGVSAPRMQTLLTALVSMKCLRLDAAGLYRNSPNVARFMVSTSKAYYGDYFKYQMGRLFYSRMGHLTSAMVDGTALDYQTWFSDPDVAATYTKAQHNGSMATASQLFKRVDLSGTQRLLDVGGGSGAFSIVFARRMPELQATVLELPEVCKSGRDIVAQEAEDVRGRVSFAELDATKPEWPVQEGNFDVVLMSYLSGSVPETIINPLYTNAMAALRPGGRLIVHDFMVDDSLDGPQLGALWALQHVTVNPEGLGLHPKAVIDRMLNAGFERAETMEMISGMTKVIIGHKAA